MIGHRLTVRQRRSQQEERERIYERDRGVCRACGVLVPWGEFELAHRIANTKANRKRHGADVVDHPLNRVVTHRGRCNDAMNIGFSTVIAEALADTIRAEIAREKESA